MEELGPVFHLPPVINTVAFDVEDWTGLAGGRVVTHRPTHCMFEITPPDEQDDEDALCFRVRLVHVCDGSPIPTPDMQQELACDALTFWACDSGLVWQQLPAMRVARLTWSGNNAPTRH